MKAVSDDTRIFTADYILKHRRRKGGRVDYLIKWEGWSFNVSMYLQNISPCDTNWLLMCVAYRYSTWEPSENIFDKSLIQTYRSSLKENRHKRSQTVSGRRSVRDSSYDDKGGLCRRRKARVDEDVGCRVPVPADLSTPQHSPHPDDDNTTHLHGNTDEALAPAYTCVADWTRANSALNKARLCVSVTDGGSSPSRSARSVHSDGVTIKRERDLSLDDVTVKREVESVYGDGKIPNDIGLDPNIHVDESNVKCELKSICGYFEGDNLIKMKENEEILAPVEQNPGFDDVINKTGVIINGNDVTMDDIDDNHRDSLPRKVSKRDSGVDVTYDDYYPIESHRINNDVVDKISHEIPLFVDITQEHFPKMSRESPYFSDITREQIPTLESQRESGAIRQFHSTSCDSTKHVPPDISGHVKYVRPWEDMAYTQTNHVSYQSCNNSTGYGSNTSPDGSKSNTLLTVDQKEMSSYTSNTAFTDNDCPVLCRATTPRESQLNVTAHMNNVDHNCYINTHINQSGQHRVTNSHNQTPDMLIQIQHSDLSNGLSIPYLCSSPPSQTNNSCTQPPDLSLISPTTLSPPTLTIDNPKYSTPVFYNPPPLHSPTTRHTNLSVHPTPYSPTNHSHLSLTNHDTQISHNSYTLTPYSPTIVSTNHIPTPNSSTTTLSTRHALTSFSSPTTISTSHILAPTSSTELSISHALSPNSSPTTHSTRNNILTLNSSPTIIPPYSSPTTLSTNSTSTTTSTLPSLSPITSTIIQTKLGHSSSISSHLNSPHSSHNSASTHSYTSIHIATNNNNDSPSFSEQLPSHTNPFSHLKPIIHFPHTKTHNSEHPPKTTPKPLASPLITPTTHPHLTPTTHSTNTTVITPLPQLTPTTSLHLTSTTTHTTPSTPTVSTIHSTASPNLDLSTIELSLPPTTYTCQSTKQSFTSQTTLSSYVTPTSANLDLTPTPYNLTPTPAGLTPTQANLTPIPSITIRTIPTLHLAPATHTHPSSHPTHIITNPNPHHSTITPLSPHYTRPTLSPTIPSITIRTTPSLHVASTTHVIPHSPNLTIPPHSSPTSIDPPHPTTTPNSYSDHPLTTTNPCAHSSTKPHKTHHRSDKRKRKHDRKSHKTKSRKYARIADVTQPLQITVTDVTCNDVTVTFLESPTDAGFFTLTSA